MSGLGLTSGEVAERRVEPFPLAGATLAADFANDRYWGGTLATLFAFARAGSKTDLTVTSPAGYAYRTFATDVPAITPGIGLLLEDPATNVFLNSTTPATQTISLSATGAYTLWVNGSGSATVSAGTAAITATPPGNLTGAAGGLIATNGQWISFSCTTTGTIDVTITGTLNAVQLEAATNNNATPTSFIVTAGASATRAVDVMNFSAGTLAVMAAVAGTIVIRSMATASSPYLAGILRTSAGTPLGRGLSDTQGWSTNNQNANGFNYTLGQGSRLRETREALSWSASDRRICANSGGIAVGSKLHNTTTTSARLGFGGTGAYLRGWIARIDLFGAQVSDAQLRALSSVGDCDVAMWGDSLTARSQVPGNSSIPAALSTMIGRRVGNFGIEGENSTAIRNRFLAEALFDRETIIMAGRNNFSATATVTADIAAMIAALTTDRYLVLSIPNAAIAAEYVGQANYDARQATNAALASAYGTRFLDLWQAMVDAYDPADPMEVTDYANRVIPWRFRQLNTASALVGAIDASATSFVTTGLAGTGLMKLGSEIINITVRSGNNVTACTRGHLGSTAAAHAAGDRIEQRDSTHWSEAGRVFAAQQIANRRMALGW